MDVRLPDFKAYVAQLKTLSQVVDWANIYHKSNSYNNRGEGAAIFIVDTAGTFQDHEDLVNNNPAYLNGNSTSDPDKDGYSGHGTHCAGIAAAVDNGRGVIGIAPKALLGARKALSDNGSGTYSAIASEIRKVADLQFFLQHRDRKKIISLSLGGPGPNSQLKSAIDYAISKGCFVIAAAGNDGYTGSDTVGYPANYEEVIAVASIKKNQNPSSFSSGGPNVDVAAYGDGNFSTYKNNTYATLRGTSMATPVVSGLAALIVTEYPEIDTQDKLMNYLKDNARDIFTDGFDDRTGYGTLITSDFKEPISEEPEPTPEPPVGSPIPIKSEIELWIKNEFKVSIRNADTEWNRCSVKVRCSADVKNEQELKESIYLVHRFFTNRGFYFLAGTGFDVWAEYISRFLYVLTNKWGHAVYAHEIYLANNKLSIIKKVNPKNFLLTNDLTDDDVNLSGQKTFTMKEIKFSLPAQKTIVDRDANLPIDKLKEVISDGFGVTAALYDIFAGNTSSGLISLAGFVGKYEKPMEAFKTAWSQAADLSEAESKDLYAFVTEKFDLEDDELEAKIERVLKLPITGYAEYLDSIDTILSIQAIWSDSTTNKWEKIKELTSYASTDALTQGEDLFTLMLETIAAIKDLFSSK